MILVDGIAIPCIKETHGSCGFVGFMNKQEQFLNNVIYGQKVRNLTQRGDEQEI